MSKLDQLRALREAKVSRKPNAFEDAARGRDPIPERKQPKAKVGTAGVTGPVRRSTTDDRVVSRVRAGRTAQDVPQPSPAGAVAIPKRGRGRPKVTGKRPWEIEGVSKRTYYRRRQKEAKQ